MTRRKDGLLQEVAVIGGKRKYFYGRTKAEVLRKLRAYEERRERGALFEQVADAWWAQHEPTLAYRSTVSYRPALERAIAEFGQTPVKEITPPIIDAFIQRFAAQGYADKTVRMQLMVCNLIFRFAVTRGDVPFNPVRDLVVPGNLPKAKRKMPSQEDIERVKASTDCTFGMFAYWAMYTGLRRGELLALEWRDVDLQARTISVNKSLYHEGNQPRIKRPKTETSAAAVPILDTLAKKITPGRGLVFPNDKGKHMTELEFSCAWRSYCRQSGVSATPHQFRHAFATMLFEAGIPPEEMQALLRHAQLSTTMDIYTELRDQKLRQIHEKVYSVDYMQEPPKLALVK